MRATCSTECLVGHFLFRVVIMYPYYLTAWTLRPRDDEGPAFEACKRILLEALRGRGQARPFLQRIGTKTPRGAGHTRQTNEPHHEPPQNQPHPPTPPPTDSRALPVHMEARTPSSTPNPKRPTIQLKIPSVEPRVSAHFLTCVTPVHIHKFELKISDFALRCRPSHRDPAPSVSFCGCVLRAPWERRSWNGSISIRIP